jgi:hypothetical protein
MAMDGAGRPEEISNGALPKTGAMMELFSRIQPSVGLGKAAGGEIWTLWAFAPETGPVDCAARAAAGRSARKAKRLLWRQWFVSKKEAFKGMGCRITSIAASGLDSGCARYDASHAGLRKSISDSLVDIWRSCNAVFFLREKPLGFRRSVETGI